MSSIDRITAMAEEIKKKKKNNTENSTESSMQRVERMAEQIKSGKYIDNTYNTANTFNTINNKDSKKSSFSNGKEKNSWISNFFNDTKAIGSNLINSASSGILQFGKTFSMRIDENQNYMNEQSKKMLEQGKKFREEKGLNTDDLNEMLNSSRLDKVDSKPFYQEKIDKMNKKMAETTEKTTNPVSKKIAELSQSLGNNLVGGAVSLVNPAAGMTYFVGSATGSYYDEGISRGMSDEEAKLYGGIMGSMEGITEYVLSAQNIKGAKDIINGQGFKNAMKSFGLEIGENFVQEAVMPSISEVATLSVAGKEHLKYDYSSQEGINQLLKDSLSDGIDGALSAILLNGATKGVSSSIAAVNKINNGGQLTQEEIQTVVQDAQESGIDTQGILQEEITRAAERRATEQQEVSQEENIPIQQQELTQEQYINQLNTLQEQYIQSQDIAEQQALQVEIDQLKAQAEQQGLTNVQEVTQEEIPMQENVAMQNNVQENIPVQENVQEEIPVNAQQITDKTYYHGTRGNFETFDNSKIGQNYEGEWSSLGKGFYFTNSYDSAKEFGKSSTNKGEVNVKEATLDIKKPFFVDDISKNDKQTIDNIIEKYELGDIANGYNLIDALNKKGLDSSEVLKESGYDGIIAEDEVMVFDASQINTNKPTQQVDNQQTTNKKNILYHGTNSNINSNYNTDKGRKQNNAYGEATYLTLDKEYAKNYGDTIYENTIKDNANIVDITSPVSISTEQLDKITDILNKNGIEATNNGEYIQTNEYGIIDPLNPNIYKSILQTLKKVDKTKIKDVMLELGIDGIKNNNTYAIYNNDVIENETNAQQIKDQQQNTPTQEEIDNLLDTQKNKSGSEYASAFFELRDKYGEANLYKALNKEYSKRKNGDTEVKEQVTEAVKPVMKAVEDLAKQVKNITNQFENIKPTSQTEVEQQRQESLDSLMNEEVPSQSGLTEIEQQEKALFDEFINERGYDALDEQSKSRYEYLQQQEVMETPIEIEESKVESPLENRDIDEVGNRKVKAYQYENPEVRPYFQTEADNMLGDLDNTIKGERIVTQEYNPATGLYENAGYTGTTRQTTEAIAYLKDNYGYSYDQIRKGLNAIIEDNGAENNAVSKRIEFMLDERLREGYTTSDGIPIPPNQEYINFLKEKQITEYNKEAFNALTDADAPVQEANIKENAPTIKQDAIMPVREKYEAIEPRELKTEKNIPMKRKTSQNENIELTDTIAENEKKEYESKTGFKEEQQDGGEKLQETLKEAQTKILTDMVEAQQESRLGEYLETAGIKIIDKGWTVKKEAHKLKNQTLEEDYNQIKHANREAVNMAMDGYTDWTVDTSKSRRNGRLQSRKTTKSIDEMFNPIKSNNETAEYYDYMYNQLNIDRMTLEERYGTDNKTLLNTTAEQSNETIKKYADNERFKTAEQDTRTYINQLQDILVDGGILSAEQKANLNEMYPHYIPAYRNVGNQVVNANFFNNNIKANDAVGKAKGGTQDILPLDHSLLVKTKQVVQSARVNKYLQNLKNSYEKAGQLNVIENKTQNATETFEESTSTERLNKTENGQYTATVYENEVKTTFEISKGQYDALKPSDIPVITTLNTFVDIKRSLLTEYNLYFATRNFLRDTPTAFLQSQDSFKWLKNLPEAVRQVATKGQYYQYAQSLGAGNNDYANMNKIGYSDIAPINTNADNQGNKFSRGWQAVKEWKGVKWISDINGFIEQVPRMAEFITAVDNGKSGAGAIYAQDEVTVNFGRGGDWTKTADRNITSFVNANIQGGYKLASTFTDAYAYNGAKGLAKVITKYALAGGAMAALMGLAWDDDDDYEELSDYIKQNYYVIGKTGDGQFIKIPKGRTNAVIEELFNSGASVMKGEKTVKEATSDLMSVINNNLAPSSLIESSLFAGIYQTLTNTSWYGEDIVPTRLQKEEAKDQYDESTDTFSIWLGQKTGLSPYKINYLLDQSTGFLGDMLLPLLTEQAETPIDNKLAEATLGQFYKDYTTDSTMKNQNVTDIFKLTDEGSDLYVASHKTGANDEDILKYKYLTSVTSDMNELYAEKRTIQNETGLSNSEKVSALREVQRKIDDLAIKGLENYENVDVQSNYSKAGSKEYYKNTKGEWVSVRDEEAQDLKDLNMTSSEKNTYFKTKNTISGIVNAYKEDKGEITIEDEDSDEYKDAVSTLSSDKKISIVNKIIDTSLNDEQKAYLYKKYYNSDTVDTMVQTGISVDDYLTYTTKEFKADYNSKGKAISGSRKNKVVNYVNSLELNIAQKAIIIKSTNSFKFNDYNDDIVSYVNGLDITYDEKKKILKDLDMTVSDDGTVSWKK